LHFSLWKISADESGVTVRGLLGSTRKSATESMTMLILWRVADEQMQNGWIFWDSGDEELMSPVF
jgi:hypothetical protein